jgi:hypothetical protein
VGRKQFGGGAKHLRCGENVEVGGERQRQAGDGEDRRQDIEDERGRVLANERSEQGAFRAGVRRDEAGEREARDSFDDARLQAGEDAGGHG